MTMKKTDLYKNLAKQIDRKQKAAATPQRFGAGAAAVPAKRDKHADATAKLVPVTCRLPAELVATMRERAATTPGGMSTLVAAAVEQWLSAADDSTENGPD